MNIRNVKICFKLSKTFQTLFNDLYIFIIFINPGLATTLAAPAEDGKANLKGFITTFLRQIGM